MFAVSRRWKNCADRPRAALRRQPHRPSSANCGRSASRSIAAIGRCLSANCGRTGHPRRTSHRVPTTTCRVRCSRQTSRAARRVPGKRPLLLPPRDAQHPHPVQLSLCCRPSLPADSAFRARTAPATMLNACCGCVKQTKQRRPPGEVLLPHLPTRVNRNPSPKEILHAMVLSRDRRICDNPHELEDV